MCKPKNTTGEKRCPNCGEEKELNTDNFYFIATKNIFHNYCKNCHKQLSMERKRKKIKKIKDVASRFVPDVAVDYGDPIRNLWARVIDNALDNLVIPNRKFSSNIFRTKTMESMAAKAFFFGKESNLDWICSHLDLSGELIREKAQRVLCGEEIYRSFAHIPAGVSKAA